LRNSWSHREKVDPGGTKGRAVIGFEPEEIDRLIRQVGIDPDGIGKIAAGSQHVRENHFDAPVGMVFDLEKEFPFVGCEIDLNRPVAGRHVSSSIIVMKLVNIVIVAWEFGIDQSPERGSELDVGRRLPRIDSE
jgi:hypothetical protein